MGVRGGGVEGGEVGGGVTGWRRGSLAVGGGGGRTRGG